MADSGVSLSQGLADLPQRYGLKVQDFVRIKHDRHVESEGQCIDTTGAGSILVAKVCDALARQGYEDDTIKKVGGLVLRNLITSDSSQVDGEAEFEESSEEGADMEVKQKVASILKGLLDKNTQRSRSVNMNSNEPVLLINGSDQVGKGLFYLATDETVQQLQQDWNIWPVRVYAGRFFPSQGTGFSVSLLNVVNTDIGGPSMVQLLDEHTEAPEWHTFVRREVWRERDLVSRGEGNWKAGDESGSTLDDGSDRSFQSDGADSTASELPVHTARLESPVGAESPSIETAENAPDNTNNSSSRQVEDHEEKHGFVDEEATFGIVEDEQEMSMAQRPVVPERKVSYPTWDRRHDSTSLIDLIRSQALDIPPLGKDDGRIEAAEEAVAEPLPAEAEQKDDESFVVL